MASKPLKPSTSTDNADGNDSKKKKSFKFTVSHPLHEDVFKESLIMEIEDENSPLIKYMEKAVDDEQNRLMEKFTVTYYSGMGYFIEAINDVRGTDLVDKSNWEIRSESKPITKGISSFIPQDGTEVVLDLITDNRGDSCVFGKSFTFTVKIPLREQSTNSVAMEIKEENSPLIEYMKKAVDEYGLMKKFTVTYDADSKYTIESINGEKATILIETKSGQTQTVTGLSSFKPEDEMNVILEPQGPDGN